MSEMQICEEVLGRVGDRAEAQVTVASGPTGLTRFANSFIHQNVAEDQRVVSLTVAMDGRVATVTSTRTDPDHLDEIVERALAIAALRPVDAMWPGMAPPAPVADVEHFDPATAGASPDARASVVADFVAAGPGLRAAGMCETHGGSLAFANSAGQRCQGRSTRAVLDGIHQTPTSAGKAHQTCASLADLDGATAGAIAAEKAQRSLDAVDLKPGRYEVVLEPNAVATILIFLSMYGFNGRAAMEQRSFVELGADQFDPAITIVDDALRPGGLGLPFDPEGTPRRRIVFVDQGRSRAHAHDRRTAGQMETESTGHALPGGSPFGAMPTNLMLEPGVTGPDEMIAGVERGLLITEFNYCRVLDPRTVGVTGLTRNGTFLIENGQITQPVANLRFTQSFVDALAPGAVASVGADARFADSEFGPGMVHAPSLRLHEWNFTGGAGG